jgi:CDP-glycerol glycerophosphotransferase (TagB/SpsB family)
MIANGLVYPISEHLPRDPKLWLFGHQDGAFAGNSKMLFLWVHEHRPDIQAVWVSENPKVVRMLRERGLPACRKGSPRAVRLSLRAAVYFFCHSPDDVSIPLSGGALLVNLWHGVGLKSLKLGNPKSPALMYGGADVSWLTRVRKLTVRLRPHVLVTTSEFMQQHFSTQFGLTPEQCPILGYPRVDASYDPAVAELLRRIPGSEPRALWHSSIAEVYAYVPTFRDSARDFLSEAIPDVARLEAALEKRNAVLYVKLHRHSGSYPWREEGRVRPWPEGVDLDASLPHLSGLITDYSSVHYDYIFHTDRGSILYMFDEEEYTANDRLLLYPIPENTAGWRVRTFDELVQLIESGKALQAHPDIAEIRRKFWGSSEGQSCERIVARCVEGF